MMALSSITGIPQFAFHIVENQALIPGSDLIEETWLNGACKITVENPPGQLLDQGSGFLFRFQSRQNVEVFGLLTCYHVVQRALHDNQPIPDPQWIYIQFKADLGYRDMLQNIQLQNVPPIFSVGRDVYFQEVSITFRNDMVARNINFFQELNRYLDQQVWIPQYPLNGDRHLATASVQHQMWFNRRHRVSTQRGSSGSPLLQLDNGELKAIGMHHAAIMTAVPMNLASHTMDIINFLNEGMGGGLLVPVGYPNQVAEACMHNLHESFGASPRDIHGGK